MRSTRKFWLIALASMVMMAGCKWFDKFTQFEMSYTKGFTIPAGVPANIPYDIYTPYFPTNSQKYFSDNNTNSDLIEGCKVREIRAAIINTEGDDFSFITSIHLYLVAKDLPEAEVAFKNHIPENIGDTLVMDINDVELVNYIKQDSLAIRVQLFTDRVNTTDIKTHLFLKFLLDAKILGV